MSADGPRDVDQSDAEPALSWQWIDTGSGPGAMQRVPATSERRVVPVGKGADFPARASDR